MNSDQEKLIKCRLKLWKNNWWILKIDLEVKTIRKKHLKISDTFFEVQSNDKTWLNYFTKREKVIFWMNI